MKISLAIPTYNSSEYFWDCIKSAISTDFIDEIVINDDSSNSNHLCNLYEIVSRIDNGKIKIFKNEQNLKAFKNKYLAVSNCKHDWVYLLDSDNYFDEKLVKIFMNVEYDPKVCYCPQRLLISDGRIVEYNYFDEYIDIDIIRRYIFEGKYYLDWFLNTGNFLVNKEEYLKTQNSFFENEEYHANNDVVIFTYYWLTGGNKYKILDGFEYYHRIRPGNYYKECPEDDNMDILVNYAKKMIGVP